MYRDLRHEEYFLFTQHSLATFDKCPLKFKKRYIENLKWNSIPDESSRKRLEMGNDFHLLAYRYFMGIDPGLDRSNEGYEELKRWIDSLVYNFPKKPGLRYLPEYKLRMSADHLKLEANIDLLVLGKETVEIWDWKTHGAASTKNRLSEADRLVKSLQTKVYMFVLKEQLESLAGSDIKHDEICMRYWQPEPEGAIAEIRYNREMHEEFRTVLENKIKTILEYDYADFDKNQFKKHCKFCEFNWYCNNERVDFTAVDEDNDFMDELDWESVEEKY